MTWLTDGDRPTDGVTKAELERELQRLREAIELVAACMGANTISRTEGEHLRELLRARVLR